MINKRASSLLLVCVLVLGCLTLPAGAAEISVPTTRVILRATDQFNADIPINSIAYLGGNISLEVGETITYNCTYSPRNASIKFGFIAPDGLFYGFSGSQGSIDKEIRVSQRGTYTLAIKNNSNSTVTVQGTVNY